MFVYMKCFSRNDGEKISKKKKKKKRADYNDTINV